MKAVYIASDNHSSWPVPKTYLSTTRKAKQTERLNQPKAKQCMSALEPGQTLRSLNPGLISLR